MTDTTPGVTPGPLEAARGRSLWQDAWRRLRRNRAAVTGAVVLTIITLLCVVGPWLTPHGHADIDWTKIGHPPTLDGFYPFGTDRNGRDLLTRTLIGGRVSLAIGLTATMVSLMIGVAYGALAGFLGGAVDNIMMRIVDILYSLPFIFLVILLIVVFGRNFLLMFVAVGAVTWLDMARIVRGQALGIKRREFIEAARATGVRPVTIVRRHVVPNAFGPVIVYTTLTVPTVILFESFLSFLGLGVQEPLTSWGVLISEGAYNLESAPWMLLFPALFLAATLYSLNFIGDGLRDALDPRDR